MLDAILMSGILPAAAEASFEEVARLRAPRILRTAYRILGNWADAEDVAQEALVRLHRHGLRFPNDAALGAWVYRVTVNLCLDRARAARPAEPISDLPSRSLSAEAAAIQAQEKQRLMNALALLPARERAALVLREIEDLDTAEVAAILGSSEGTVRSQVSKAIARLREILTREDQ
jgi:RNA polymerase sigma-70 factor (ECF subfamily)